MQFANVCNQSHALWLATDRAIVQLGFPPASKQVTEDEAAVIDIRPVFLVSEDAEVA